MVLNLMCSSFEYCTWTFIPQDESGEKSCDFEWKRKSWSVEKQRCDWQNDVEYVGDYEAHECKVKCYSRFAMYFNV